VIGVPAGNPLRFTTNVTADVRMLPAASLVTLKVIVAVPVPPASELLIGGTSFAVESAAVNVGCVGEVVVGAEEFEQPTANNASAEANRDWRFI
jgi:hypothetical protein